MFYIEPMPINTVIKKQYKDTAFVEAPFFPVDEGDDDEPALELVVVREADLVGVPPLDMDALDSRVARKLSHAATDALGTATVLIVDPEPTKICGAATTTSLAVPVKLTFSPPIAGTDAFVTRPVWLDPKINSRASTNA
jgi:hypothetical protein